MLFLQILINDAIEPSHGVILMADEFLVVEDDRELHPPVSSREVVVLGDESVNEGLLVGPDLGGAVNLADQHGYALVIFLEGLVGVGHGVEQLVALVAGVQGENG